MTHNYGKLEGIMADLYQYLQDNPTDEMARDVLTRLGTSLSKYDIFTKRIYYPSLKDSLIDNLDSKAQALSKAEEDTKAKLR